MSPHSLFVATTPGLEAITAHEVAAISGDAASGPAPGAAPSATPSPAPSPALSGLKIEPGGIALAGSLTDAFALNLHLRTASRVLVRIAEFRAAHFAELEKRATRIDWSPWVAPGAEVEWAVTSRKSRLYHTEGIAERLAKAAGVTAVGAGAAGVEAAAGGAPTRIVVRAVRDHFTVSLDTSGDHLHQRGDRVAQGNAPLRETMAAALLIASGWAPDTPLLDPMCGTGTIVIEAARMATRRAPGLARTFALEHAPAFSEEHQAAAMRLREAAQAAICAAPAPIIGRDRDIDAIAAARANIAAASLEDVIALEVGAVSSAQPPHAAAAPGFIVTNPPWGLRLGDEAALRDLYAALGRVARERFFDWGLTLITPSAKLASAADRRLKRLIELRQGGVNLGLWGTPGE